MPAKKMSASSKTSKKASGAKLTKKTAAKKTAKDKNKAKPASKPSPSKETHLTREPVTPSPAPTVELIECDHCEGSGKCAKGTPYDKGHHQGLFADVRLTSCFECLDAAGESRNTKKLIVCRICKGTGKVPKP